MYRPIRKCLSTSCCACFASTAALMSNGCMVFARSLHDCLAGHLRVDREEVRISSHFAEGVSELLIRIKHFGFEDAVRADDRMWDIVAVGPRHRCSHGYGERSRAEAEVIDLYLRGFRLLLRARQQVLLAYVD